MLLIRDSKSSRLDIDVRGSKFDLCTFSIVAVAFAPLVVRGNSTSIELSPFILPQT